MTRDGGMKKSIHAQVSQCAIILERVVLKQVHHRSRALRGTDGRRRSRMFENLTKRGHVFSERRTRDRARLRLNEGGPARWAPTGSCYRLRKSRTRHSGAIQEEVRNQGGRPGDGRSGFSGRWKISSLVGERAVVWAGLDMAVVRYGFIKIMMNVVNFIKNHFHQKPLSSKTTFIKNHFHQKPLSSKTTFIKNHFHQKPLSSKTTFIKNHFHQKPLSSKTTFIKNHFHQKPLSSKTTFIKNHFHQKPLSSKTTFVKNHFHEKPRNLKLKTLSQKP